VKLPAPLPGLPSCTIKHHRQQNMRQHNIRQRKAIEERQHQTIKQPHTIRKRKNEILTLIVCGCLKEKEWTEVCWVIGAPSVTTIDKNPFLF